MKKSQLPHADPFLARKIVPAPLSNTNDDNGKRSQKTHSLRNSMNVSNQDSIKINQTAINIRASMHDQVSSQPVSKDNSAMYFSEQLP